MPKVGCGSGSHASIGEAVAAAASGDTISVCRGTYAGGIVITTERLSIAGNRVVSNSGGVLLDDDTGATYGNLVEDNAVSGNALDCGITIATTFRTSSAAASTTTRSSRTGSPTTARPGQGGGVLLASGVPGDVPGIPGTGGAVLDNLIEDNYLAGNGLADVTLHSHSPGENLNGNVVVGNRIGTNNLAPDMDFGPHYFDGETTGVIVMAVSNVSITVEHNLISNDVNGIWVGQVGSTITVNGAAANLFVDVTNPLSVVS